MPAKITYTPWNEIVVHEVKESSVQQFLEGIVTQLAAQGQVGVVPAVSWVDGIAFVFGAFPDTPEVVKDKLDGKIHFALVNFTRMSYQPEKKVTVGNRDYIVRMIKAEENPDFVNLVSFLKEDFKPKES